MGRPGVLPPLESDTSRVIGKRSHSKPNNATTHHTDFNQSAPNLDHSDNPIKVAEAELPTEDEER